MIDEIEELERYIKREYLTKESFAIAIGMTRQNLNYHFREAKKNGNVFTNDFKTKLWVKHIDILAFKRELAEAVIKAKNEAAEDGVEYLRCTPAEVKRIQELEADKKDLRFTIEQLKITNEALREEIEKLKAPIINVEKPAAAGA